MFPADKTSVTHKKDLHHSFILVSGKGNNIFIVHFRTCNLLFLVYLFHTVQQISVAGRLFKIHFLGSRIHLLCQHLNDRFKVAAKKMQHLSDIFTVFFLRNIGLTRCLTLSHMIIQTWPVITCFLRQTAVAAADFVNFLG